MEYTLPVMNVDASLKRNATKFATSSATPGLPSAVPASSAAFPLVAYDCANMGVWIAPLELLANHTPSLDLWVES
jgi:hypothetical protein